MSVFHVVVVNLTLTDTLRVQPWSQDRRNQIKSKREYVQIKAGKASGKENFLFKHTIGNHTLSMLNLLKVNDKQPPGQIENP